MRSPILLLLGLTACAPKAVPTPQAEPVVPCGVQVPASSGEEWRQVVAEGFTFCVPASWRPEARNTIRGDGGWFRWGVGVYRPTATRTVTVAVPAGQLPPSPSGRQHRFSESIGGTLAELWDNELEGTLYTGAQWRKPRPIYLLGQSTSQRARSRQLQVYRTVRFTAQ